MYIQITSGRGPEECCRVVVLVMEKLIHQTGTQNIFCKLIDYEPGLHDVCLFSATLVAEGDEMPLEALRAAYGLRGWKAVVSDCGAVSGSPPKSSDVDA